MADTLGRTADVTVEVTAWLDEQWDPDLTVAEWWDRLCDSGWAAPQLPTEWYGRGLSRVDAVKVQTAIAQFGALGAPKGLGLLLAGPTIAVHGDDDQRRRYLRDTISGKVAWAQLFSEPGAGSDLAGLTTRAVQDGDHWIVNGQKVWTSGAQAADLGMLLARTDIDVPKHQGISYFVVDMHQPGIDIRPLREITGRAMFSEVFLTDAIVVDSSAIGGLNNGWAVANTTLGFERAGLGAGGSGGGTSAWPGARGGDLERRAGDFVRMTPKTRTVRAGRSSSPDELMALARENGMVADATVRQGIAALFTLNEIARFTNLRAKALRGQGKEIPGVGNMAKLSMSRILRLSRELSLHIIGPYGTLHAYDDAGRAELLAITGESRYATITEAALFSAGPSIYGGTDEIQHNILGERVLGLPKEPNHDRIVAFRELPKNR
jgi:alkylation response protein AidB-like acyl-CoA dehydrogenase